MARNQCLVLLGFEDDPITEKHRSFVDFTTNKVGGRPVSVSNKADKIDIFCQQMFDRLCSSNAISFIFFTYRIGQVQKLWCLHVPCAAQCDDSSCKSTHRWTILLFIVHSTSLAASMRPAPMYHKVGFVFGCNPWTRFKPNERRPRFV